MATNRIKPTGSSAKLAGIAKTNKQTKNPMDFISFTFFQKTFILSQKQLTFLTVPCSL